MNNEKVLDISWESIFKILILVIVIYLLYALRDIFVWVIFAIIISVLFEPIITFFTRRKVPRFLAAILVYFITFGFIGFLIYLTVPILSSEIQQSVKILPQYFDKISPPLRALGFKVFENIEAFTGFLNKTLEGMAQTIFNAVAVIFGGALATFSIISISLFLSLEEKPIAKTLRLIVPKKYEEVALDLWLRCERKIAGWFLSRILGCVFVGILSYLSFLILKIKYPFTLGFLAGVFNFLPIIGPVITGLIIFGVTFLENFWQAIFVLIIFVLIQQIENNVLLPALTTKFMELPPVIILLALTIGGILWGIWGALLAIPFFGILFEFLKEFLQKKKEKIITV